jgi:hypothetical protein
MLGKLFLILAAVCAVLWIGIWYIGSMNIIFSFILGLPMMAVGFGFGLFLILGIVFLVIGK